MGPVGVLHPPAEMQGGGFGTSVAVSRGVFIVGAPGNEASAPHPGEVFIFTHAEEVSSVERPALPRPVRVDGPYPNPARGEARLLVHLDQPMTVSFRVHEMRGRVEAAEDRGLLPAGTHALGLRTTRLPSGVYGYTLQAGPHTVRGLLVVVR